jgi:hypothetical protein
MRSRVSNPLRSVRQPAPGLHDTLGQGTAIVGVMMMGSQYVSCFAGNL